MAAGKKKTYTIKPVFFPKLTVFVTIINKMRATSLLVLSFVLIGVWWFNFRPGQLKDNVPPRSASPPGGEKEQKGERAHYPNAFQVNFALRVSDINARGGPLNWKVGVAAEKNVNNNTGSYFRSKKH